MSRFVRWCAAVCVGLLVSGSSLAQDDEEADVDEAADEEEVADEEEAPAKDCPVPDRVEVGAFVNNIQTLSLQSHTYEVDFYLWFKWCNPDIDPATTLEFMNPSELWGMMITPTYEEPEELPDGSLHQVLRVQGRFSTKMPLYDYPFDRQVIGPAFEDSYSNRDTMVYALDPLSGVTLNPELTLPGYLIGTPALVFTQDPYVTAFGDPREAARPIYTRAHLQIPLTRPLASQLTQLFVPLFTVMLSSALMLVIGRYYVDSRIAVGTTALLTIVALQLTYNQGFSDVGYLMLMDKVYLVSYVYVLAGLGVVVLTSPPSYEAAAADPSTARSAPIPLIVTSAAYLLVCAVLIGLAAMPG